MAVTTVRLEEIVTRAGKGRCVIGSGLILPPLEASPLTMSWLALLLAAGVSLLQALREANRRAGEVEGGAQPVLEKTLKAEV